MRKLIVIVLMCCYTNAEAQSSALDLANDLFAKGNYTKAIEAYKTVDNITEVYDKIARSYSAIGNYGLAIEFYKKSIDAHPDNAILKYDYAKLLLNTKQYNEASKLFEELIYSDYKNPNYHYQKGIVLEKLKDSTAINRFLAAYDLDNTHQNAIIKIARYYLIKRNHNASHRLIDKGLESYPSNTKLISLKAQNYYYQDYISETITWFKKLLDMGESSEFIHEKLSIVYGKNSDYEDAIYHRKKVLQYNPLDATSMYVIGTYYERLNDFKNAEEYMSKALKIMDTPLNKEYVSLAKVLNRQGKHEEAIATFKKALKEDPSDTFTKYLILRTKDEYYADREAIVTLYEDFIKSTEEPMLKRLANYRLKELKEEIFLNKD